VEYIIDGNAIEVPQVMADKPSWKVLLNGEEVTDVTSLAVINEPMGIGFFYGGSMTGGPYNQGHLYNRGGAVVAIVVRKGREIFVAALEQMRPLQSDELVLEFPRGQSRLGESGSETALRELREETGIGPESIIVTRWLGSGNPDNALILGENVQFFSVEILETDVDWVSMRIREDAFQPEAESRLVEGIKNSTIMPLNGLTSTSMMTMSAIGLLRAHAD
jgi:8-oxo-dGTP pyrophosphatase MutT (NUDIX family)